MENSFSDGVSLLILADDLTGSLDTGVQFAKRTDVEVYLSLDDAIQSRRETDTAATVRVINTDTRHASAEEARSAVTAAVNALRDCLPNTLTSSTYLALHFYKKIDSCLRGNIGAELEALMKATGCSRLPFVPAYPALKRTTRGGFQYLDGVLIHESPMANDPLNPVTDSFIPSIIGKQSKIPVRLVGTDLRGTEPRGTDPAGTEHILVFDGETPAHLEAAAKTLREGGLLRVSAGCAGFAEALMEALPFGQGAAQRVCPQRDRPLSLVAPGDRPLGDRPILVVTGSLNSVSVVQVKAAREKGVPCFGIAEEDLLAEGWFCSERALSLAADCRRLLQQRGIAVLGTDLAVGKTGTDLLTPETHGNSRQVANGLGKITQSILNEAVPLNLVVFGGDTLLGIMKTLGYKRLRPVKEVFPGVVLAETDGNKGWLVTKSGAFGERGLILRIKDFLRN